MTFKKIHEQIKKNKNNKNNTNKTNITNTIKDKKILIMENEDNPQSDINPINSLPQFNPEFNTVIGNLGISNKLPINIDSQYPYLFLIFSEENKIELKNNLLKILQKLGTSSKTRILHPIISDNLFKIYTEDPEKRIEGDNCKINLKENKLLSLNINISSLLDIEDINLIKVFLNINNELNLHKSKITDNNEYIISNLIKNKNIVEKEIISKINYFKAVELLYSGYLETLTIVAKNRQNIFKLLEKASITFGMVLNNILTKYGANNPQLPQLCQKIMLIYLINHYSQDSEQQIRTFLFKNNIISQDEYDRYFKLRNFDDLSKYLIYLKISNITPNSLKNNFKIIIGETGVFLLENKGVEKLFPFLIISSSVNPLYNNYLVNNLYKQNLKDLEILLSNVKSYIIF